MYHLCWLWLLGFVDNKELCEVWWLILPFWEGPSCHDIVALGLCLLTRISLITTRSRNKLAFFAIMPQSTVRLDTEKEADIHIISQYIVNNSQYINQPILNCFFLLCCLRPMTITIQNMMTMPIGDDYLLSHKATYSMFNTSADYFVFPWNASVHLSCGFPLNSPYTLKNWKLRR